MGNLNRAILTGRLTADPEVRYTTNELPVAKFSLAIPRPSKNGDKEVDFINCVAFSGLAKICGEYLKKGKLVAVEGRIQVHKYEDKSGNKRVYTDIIANNIQMLERKFYKPDSSEAGNEEKREEIEIIEPTKPAVKRAK
jgi:single-strand DNA-binding protein